MFAIEVVSDVVSEAWRLSCCLIPRPDHVMGMEGNMGPPGSQNNMGPSNSEGSMYSPSRYPSQQRSAPVCMYSRGYTFRNVFSEWYIPRLRSVVFQTRWLRSAVSRHAVWDASIWDVPTATGESSQYNSYTTFTCIEGRWCKTAKQKICLTDFQREFNLQIIYCLNKLSCELQSIYSIKIF